MSDIGFSELLLVLTIALIVIGPKRLPEAARFLGYWTGRIQRAIQGARRDMERELGIDDVRREVHNQLLLEDLAKERKQVEAAFQRSQAQPPPAAAPCRHRTKAISSTNPSRPTLRAHRCPIPTSPPRGHERNPEPSRETPLVEHLIELRDRLLRCLLAIGILVVAMFPFANRIYDYVSAPLRKFLPEGSSMIATDVASPFLAPFKLSFVMAILAAVPFILYQTWAFVAPGLYKKERHIMLPLFASSVVLFYGGMAFAYYLVFPMIFGFSPAPAPSTSR